MNKRNDPPKSLSIRELLGGEANYIIPMYQRNYAWEEGEITQLIQDIIDYLPENRNYYIGTLVVFERTDSQHNNYETIDGQQRLTTLSLLVSYLNNQTDCDVSWYKKLAIDFDSRPHSRQTFSEIFKGGFTDDPAELLKPQEINTAILSGYRLIKKILPQKLAENDIKLQHFSEFLFNNVQIMRVKVPKDTDLNHYFEIMNNRGEQLEKHEVLKSQMMSALDDDKGSQNCLHMVWEACANMEKYVQMGFSPRQRDAIFGAKDWGRFDVRDFEAFRKKIIESTDELPEEKITQSTDRNSEQTLNDIIETNSRIKIKQTNDDKASERFNTVINFSNFLLHVLRVQTELDVPLDDKRLISTFKTHILKGDDDAERIKAFIFNLLRCKFLYDQYVIKREFIKGIDGWSLKRLKWNEGGYYVNTFDSKDANGIDNRRILMLLSAFHVSTPTPVYKHWLNAVLHYLFNAVTIRADEYLAHLESVAKSFVFDRFLSTNRGLDYFTIIYSNKGICQARKETISNDMDSKLSFDNIENNLVFNFLDYLLWVKYHITDNIVKDFEFTFRSSVEHYYPQHPLPGHDSLPLKILNSFGNLCLISHSKNSRLSNFMPTAKIEFYKNNKIDSVKQYLMMKDKLPWNEASIKTHANEMKETLLNVLEPQESE